MKYTKDLEEFPHISEFKAQSFKLSHLEVPDASINSPSISLIIPNVDTPSSFEVCLKNKHCNSIFKHLRNLDIIKCDKICYAVSHGRLSISISWINLRFPT